jgi:hypothetical protein
LALRSSSAPGGLIGGITHARQAGHISGEDASARCSCASPPVPRRRIDMHAAPHTHTHA